MKDIVFVTTSLHTKWIKIQSDIIKKQFPNSQHLIIDGRSNWPNSWFYWINEAKKSQYKWYIHIDEYFFLTDKCELLKCIDKMETENIDLLGCSDGYMTWRQHNPIAINTFLMIGKIEHLKDIDFNGIKFAWMGNSWINNMGLHYKNEYSKGFEYKHRKVVTDKYPQEECKYDDFEPYYAFQWKMKERGLKFDYLYPHFDDRFNSTNPRITENSPDIGIHMWYLRSWNSLQIVMGKRHIDRYMELEKFLKNSNLIHE